MREYELQGHTLSEECEAELVAFFDAAVRDPFAAFPEELRPCEEKCAGSHAPRSSVGVRTASLPSGAFEKREAVPTVKEARML